MKSRNLIFLFFLVCMVSCTAESENLDCKETSTLSLVRNYNARSLDYTSLTSKGMELSLLPVVSVEEVSQILSELRSGKQSCGGQSVNRTDGDGMQTFLTVSSSLYVHQDHCFVMEMDFIQYKDDGSLYYKANHGKVMSSIYKWHIDGFRLSSTDQGGLYNFECSSCLYFKINDGVTTYIQVPVNVKGSYCPDNHEISFSISL